MADTPNIAVIGGGIIGLSIAWRLAQRGCAVSVLEKDQLGRGATWAAAGMLAAGTEAEPGETALVALGMRSQDLWPAFADALESASGIDLDLRREGTLTVALTRDDARRLEQAAEIRRAAGVKTEWLDRRALRQKEPYLAPGANAALYCADDHQVDNRAVLRALIAACRAAGVALYDETPVDGLVEQQGAVRGVRCGDTVHRADAVIVAAGPWSAAFNAPVRPLKGQSLALRMDAERPVLRHVLWGPNLYMAPKSDGRLIIGATMEEVGFNAEITAGGMLSLLEAAWRLVPSVEDLPIDESWAGFRPGSRDDAPLLGPAGPDGLIMATGHHRNGILLAPVTAEIIADYVCHGTQDAALNRFAADRFGRHHEPSAAEGAGSCA